jgi:acyl-homoserine-lactone acylase
MLWTSVHEYNELPRVLDPVTGWLQNANDPPWTTTFPSPLEPDRYPGYMAPRTALAFRPQRSARLLAQDSLITFQEFLSYKHDTHVEAADHILEDVIMAARSFGSERARRAAQVLADWDRQTNADSRGALLFEAFWRSFARQRGPNGTPFDVPWRADAPFSTPDGIANPQAVASILDSAAEQVESRFGALDTQWGDVYRLRRDNVDLPAQGGPGGMGVFRVLGFNEAPDGKFVASSGDSWMAAIEFRQPLRAHALLTYGNASQPHSRHRSDQLYLYASKSMRVVWRLREDVESHLELREAY